MILIVNICLHNKSQISLKNELLKGNQSWKLERTVKTNLHINLINNCPSLVRQSDMRVSLLSAYCSLGALNLSLFLPRSSSATTTLTCCPRRAPSEATPTGRTALSGDHTRTHFCKSVFLFYLSQLSKYLEVQLLYMNFHVRLLPIGPCRRSVIIY